MQAFQVYARVRPLNDREILFGHNRTVVTHVDECTVAVGAEDSRSTGFQVDAVFDQHASNQQIFDRAVRPLADNFLSGINSTVFAYGMTGAGKSFTMFGKQIEQDCSAGIIQMAFEYICCACESDEGIKLGLSYMEIYNEQVFDLLRSKSQNLQIQDDPVLGVVVCDLEEVEIRDSRTAQNYIQQGNHRRVIAETKANEFSSRSHAIVQITMEKVHQDSIYTAKFSLVDLAGSERQNVYSESKGIRNFEGSNINRSLLTLGNCINILSEKRKSPFIPYRDSKLTRLLKESLGGNTKTAMIACISPSVLTCDQTLNTMKYACRARKIQKSVHQNLKEPRTIEEMKREVCRLRKELETVRCTQDYRCSVRPREDTYSLVHKLIKNVEALTLLRGVQGSQLSDRIRQIDLMDEQRELVACIVACQQKGLQQPKASIGNSLICDSNEDTGVQARRRAQTTSTQQLNMFSRGEERLSRPVSKKYAKKKKQSEREGEQDQNEQSGSKQSVPLKYPSYVRPNLQNIRLRFNQNRKNLREIVLNYHENYSVGELRVRESERAAHYLSELDMHQQFLSGEDFRVLKKIQFGEHLQGQQIERYSLEDIKSAAQQGQTVGSEILNEETSKEQGSDRKESRNRFLSSLEGVRRMMLKINATTQMVTPQKYEGEFENQFEYGSPLYADS